VGRLIVETPACAICIDDFEPGDTIAVSSLPNADRCDHVFHAECYLAWLSSSAGRSCPICRGSFVAKRSELFGAKKGAVEEDGEEGEADIEMGDGGGGVGGEGGLGSVAPAPPNPEFVAQDTAFGVAVNANTMDDVSLE
jgi:hypothetical protein